MIRLFRRIFTRTKQQNGSDTATTADTPAPAVAVAATEHPQSESKSESAPVVSPPAPDIQLVSASATLAPPEILRLPAAPSATPLADLPEPPKEDRRWFGEELFGVASPTIKARTDATKLQRFGLPVFNGEQELADWLGISLSRLRWYTHDRPAEQTWHYVRHVAKKRDGGDRVILAPKTELKGLQRKVLHDLLIHVPVSRMVHGFVHGRSIVTNAQQHVGKQVVLKLDIKDFFPSITYPRVRGLFITLGYSFPVASTLALLCTEYDREIFEKDGKRYYISVGPRHLVQGAPTSPMLANLVAWRMDRRLSGLAAKYGFTYTRYADDLTFSGENVAIVQQLRIVANHVIDAERFTVNTKKTRVSKRATRQIVTGLVVNEKVALTRKQRHQLRAIFHNVARDGIAAQSRQQKNFRAWLDGMVAYVNSVNPAQAATLRADLSKAEK
jgi:RNA-directed DNA polymerase